MLARMKPDLVVREQYVTTADGWSLHLRRTLSPAHFDPEERPLLIVPGYGMNTFIFSFHPRGSSMERCLAEGGYEVWSLNLRGQGHSEPAKRVPGEVSLRNYALIDIPTAVERVLASTKSRKRELVLIGCSLGGSIVYGHLALSRKHHIAEVITMGAPLRWEEVHPLVKVAFSSPKVAGAFRMSGTRDLVRGALPILLRVPRLLDLYMNAATIDTEHMGKMAETVEDPHPAINQDIARWIGRRDLYIDDRNITEAVRELELPLLVVLSNRDGIVPERTALTVLDYWGGRDTAVLRVGDDRNWYAHANLFIANDAPKMVFEPLMRWLRRKAA